MTKMVASSIDISKALTIHGWMSENELNWLATIASQSKKIVEFGSHHGRSTRVLADNTDGIVYAVDPWGGPYLTDSGAHVIDVDTYVLPHFKNNLRDHIDSGKVKPCRMYSSMFNECDDADFVFIDGDHRYKTVIEDIEKVLSITTRPAVISGHDYGHPLWPGVKQAVDKYFGPVSVVDTIWHLVKY